MLDAAGGPARARVVLTLAAVLGLSGADTATISATANDLERAFHVGNTEIGLLVSVVSLVGALITIPVGILTDRTRRTRLLGGSIFLWAAATLLSGAATSFIWLLLARVALGAVTATAGPTVASLTGDFFPPADRGRVYGLILGGDLVGSGIGFIVSGDISSLMSWRFGFWWLAVPGLPLAWLAWRLPEPARGGSSSLPTGAQRIPEGHDATVGGRGAAEVGHARPQAPGEDAAQAGLAERAVEEADVEPDPGLVLHSDPTDRSIWWAVRYVLRVRTNVIILASSALGYFFFAGLRSFAIIFATGHYGISKPTATALVVIIGAGALAGVFAGGRVADQLLRRGYIRARILIPAICLLALAPVLAPAIALRSVAVALPLLTFGAFLLGAPNPPLDAARLDIIHPRLWGRAEAIRTVLRSGGEAAAPLLFGFVSQYAFGGPAAAAGGSGSGGAAGAGTDAAGLEYTFLIFLIPLVAAGLLTLAALRTYPRDVAAARASVLAICRSDDRGEQSRNQRVA